MCRTARGAAGVRHLKEPPRGLAEGYVRTSVRLRSRSCSARSGPTHFRHLLFAATISSFALNAVASFVLPFYLRGFGLPLAVVGAMFGAVALTSMAGHAGGWLRIRLALAPRCALVDVGPRWLFSWRPLCISPRSPARVRTLDDDDLARELRARDLQAPTLAMPQNLAGPRMRAIATAIVWLSVGLVGAGLGPYVLGVTSDFLAAQAFGAADFIASCPGGRAAADAAAGLDDACRDAARQGLRQALMAVLVFFVWASVHFIYAARTLRQDRYVLIHGLKITGADFGSSPA